MHIKNNPRLSLAWSEPRQYGSGCEVHQGESRHSPGSCQSRSPERPREGAQHQGPRGPSQAPPGVSTSQSRADKLISSPSSRKTQVRADSLVMWGSAGSEGKRHGVGSKGKSPAPGVMPGGLREGRDRIRLWGASATRGRPGRSHAGRERLRCQGKGRGTS